MASREKPNVLKTADGLLAEIRDVSRRRRAREAEVEARLAAIREVWAPGIQDLVEEEKALDREIQKLMKERAGEIFDGRDQVDLEHGILLAGEERKVRIPRGALELIKARGWMEAVKIAEAVDRGVVEAWPEERLVEIGAERRTVVRYGYEIAEEK